MNEPIQRTHHRFDTYGVALEMIEAVRPLHARMRTHDAALAEQLRKAASSAALNLSEGRRKIGQGRLHLWRISAGSTAESRTCLDVAERWGYLEPSQTAAAHALLDRLAALLWRLTH